MEFSDKFIESFLHPRNDLLVKMEQYAQMHRIPIMQLPAMEVLEQFLRIQRPKTLLEIGTAIGYSALRIAQALPDCRIVTIERDRERVQLAKQFIGESDAVHRITVIEGDALEVDVANIQSVFDAVFIDAAKGQNMRFFERFSPLVPAGGVIYIDNIYMHGLSDMPVEEVPRGKRSMIRKLKEFTEWIKNHPDYQTTFVPVGDGLLICLKR
ncbi:O-methyltransferase [Ureibacillus sp. FSL K6-8385]|uniref:tRNA 5-hydroxyuridine methyltransferase n=1 Tax=Ureibacillus terrenus TaxID=118246 RepID=A0A540V4Z5_9BACL|nr:O-methyltransferase [Ureibacillus terrenus]MED3661486.1 O-methyltransferase [Ureibacillus terrenus]MED3763953.1 O-methyltransferase [Ureibacillus terrenus]TQE91824.1 O-methyltransferase [Ureibacillus terrenus]